IRRRAGGVGEAQAEDAIFLLHPVTRAVTAPLLADIEAGRRNLGVGVKNARGLLRTGGPSRRRRNRRPVGSDRVDPLCRKTRTDKIIDESLELAELQVVANRVHEGELAAGAVIEPRDFDPIHEQVEQKLRWNSLL